MNLITAKKVLQGIAKGEYKIDLCYSKTKYMDRYDELDDIRVLPKESISPSVQMFSNLVLQTLEGKKNMPVFLKLFPTYSIEPERQPDLDGLKYEIDVYKNIVDRVITQDISPNFIAYIASACCKKANFINRRLVDDIPRDMIYNHCILLTERAGNGKEFGFNSILLVTSLQNIYTTLVQDDNRMDLAPLLFQIYNALEVMNRFRINHNDLHTGNILVMELPERINLGFKVDSQLYKIRTKYIPYIFDWDLSYCELLGDNPKIGEFFKHTNIYNKYVPKRDLYIVLCHLHEIELGQDKKTGLIDFGLFPINVQKERQDIIPITRDQVDRIRQYKSIYKQYFTGNPVYQLGKRQVEEIFGKNIGKQSVKNLNTITLEVTRKGVQYFARIVTGFYCRPTAMHAKFPTPLQLMEKMERFKVSSIKPDSVQKMYQMPKPDLSKRIYIDSTLSREGREKLENQGIKPRFSPAKSGYIKILKTISEEKMD